MGNVIEEFKKHNELKKAAKEAGIEKEESKMEDKKTTPEGQEGQENSGADTPQKESKKGKILGVAKKVGGYALAGLAGAAAVIAFAVTRKNDDPDEAEDDSDEDDQQEEADE